MSRRRVGLTVLVSGLIGILAGCGPERPAHSGDADLDARVRVSPTPAVVGESRVLVQATDGGRPLSGAAVRLRAEAVDTAPGGIPAPGGALAPGLDHPVPAAPSSPGSYGPVVLHFPAPGSWRLVVDVTTPDGRSATLRHPIAVVGPPGS